MNTHHLIKVRRMFTNDFTPRNTIRHNIRAWVRSVRFLGDKWLVAKPIVRQL